MRTDDLIRTLAADHDWRTTPTPTALLIALASAAPVSLAFFFAVLGPRPDFTSAVHSPFFDLKFAVTLALAMAASALVLRLAQPGRELGRRHWAFLLPALLLGGGIIADLASSREPNWTARAVGKNSLICLTAIPAMALPLLVTSMIALRRGATTRPALAGAGAGLLCGALSATAYAAHCTDDSPLFVAVWYSIGIAALALVGAFAGARLLRI